MRMIIINNKNADPYLNHAIEEHILSKMEDDCFMLWQNSPCVLIGKNQNAYAEINMDYIHDNNIAVVRRITGGGAVFNDNGNFNFTFIANKRNDEFADFSKFTAPIISALRNLNVNAEFQGRNDLVIDGKKFSGNAQCKLKDKILHHGTLLFSVDLEALTAALNVNYLKLQSNAVASTRSRVTNISEHLKPSMTLEEFRDRIIAEVKSYFQDVSVYDLTQEDIIAAEAIASKKYRQPEWNFREQLNFTMQREKKYKGGLIQLNADIKNGIIIDINFLGDFFSEKDIDEVESALRGEMYEEESLRNILMKFNIDLYFKNITLDELISLIIG